MPRVVSATMAQSYESDASTRCWIMRIDPVTPGFSSFGACGLDRGLTYDDGDDELFYSPIVGFQPSTLMATADLSIDNAESKGLLPEFDFPISEADIIAGVYDFAEFTAYEVDYENLVPASGTILAHGTLGRFRIVDYGLSFVEELRGLADQLKQSVCQKDSLGCRAIFGSQYKGAPGAEVTELFPCLFDTSTLLVAGSVTSVGIESTITFTDSGLVATTNQYSPGMLKWTSGANTGRSYEVETNTNTGTVTLSYPTAFPIANGDGYLIREDCNKQARDESKGCKAHFGADWILHFRGEPDIPIGDQGALETPGASSAPGQGGSSFTPLEDPA